MLKLVIEDDEGNQQLISLEKDEFEISIGRIEGNNIRLKERNVSRRHALLSRGSDGIVYLDDFPRYGTKINGQRPGEGAREAVKTADAPHAGNYTLSVAGGSEWVARVPVYVAPRIPVCRAWCTQPRPPDPCPPVRL